jgi:signal peptidase II
MRLLVALRERLPYLLLVIAALGLDQVTKALVQQRLAMHESLPVIDGLLSVSHVRNPGAAFGFLSNAELPHQRLAFTAVGLAALLALVAYSLRVPARHRLPQVGLALVMGGAVGNLVDRVRLGYVVDFVHVYWKQYQWWDFNVADSCISVGVALLVLDALLSPRGEREPRPGAKSSGVDGSPTLVGRGE